MLSWSDTVAPISKKFQRIKNGCGTKRNSYPLVNSGWFNVVKQTVSAASHSPIPNAVVKNEWSYTSTPWCDFALIIALQIFAALIHHT